MSLLLACCACAEQRAAGNAAPAAPVISVSGESLPLPPGADPLLMRQLAAELSRILATRTHQAAARSTAYFTPARSDDGADAVLSWQYFHPGDYNQDGQVDLGDLAPLGIHYGQAQGGANWAQHAVADGNRDGVTNLADVTPIGLNWHKRVERFSCESAPGPGGPWSPAGELARSDGQTPAGGGLRTYELRVTGGAAQAEFRAYGDDSAGVLPRAQQLRDARHFMYELQELEEPGRVAALAATYYDALVVEPTKNVQGSEDFDLAGMVAALKASADSQGGHKLVLAYVNIGQAEDYRTYWQADWVPPTLTQRGVPDFMLMADPDGWAGNYPVAYWDPRWQALVVDDPDSLLRLALTAGFDGIYMDWVGGYSEPLVAQVAVDEGKDPAAEMVAFISHIRAVARQADPQFLVVQQNAPDLIHDAAGLTNVIDGLALEDIWFLGDANAPWGDPGGGDIPQASSGEYSTPALIALAQDYQAAGLPVLSVDYCLLPANAAQVYADSQALGFIPLVTQIALSQITGTPPPWY